VERVDIARTLTALDPDRLVHSEPKSSSGMMAQKIFISLIVNCLANSRGSKSRMVGLLPPIFQFLRTPTWLLVRVDGGSGVSAGMYCEIDVEVFPIEETRRGTRGPSVDVTF